MHIIHLQREEREEENIVELVVEEDFFFCVDLDFSVLVAQITTANLA